MLIFLVLNDYYNVTDKIIGYSSRSSKVLAQNTSLKGISLFYDALKEMDYSVEIDSQDFLEHPSDDIYIIAERQASSSFPFEKAIQWIKNGGKLVYFSDNPLFYQEGQLIKQYQGKAFLYSLEKGSLLLGDIDLISNETLAIEKEGAIFIVGILEELQGTPYFNEYYRLLRGNGPSLYGDLPLHIKILLFQLFLLLMCSMVYFGKRFGKAEGIMEEIERDENEYLHAAANLYEKADATDIIQDAYYKEFKNHAKYFTIQNMDLNEFNNIGDIYDFSQWDHGIEMLDKNEKNLSKKEIFHRIKEMDECIETLVQRREEIWKRLKHRNLSKN